MNTYTARFPVQVQMHDRPYTRLCMTVKRFSEKYPNINIQARNVTGNHQGSVDFRSFLSLYLNQIGIPKGIEVEVSA